MRRPDERTVLVALGAATAIAFVLVAVSMTGDGKDGGGSTGRTATLERRAETGTKAERAERRPRLPAIVIRDGEPVGGVEDLRVDAGDVVRFRVRSDVSDEIHIHGYDISKEVEAGEVAPFDFPAEIEGVFEVELEQRGVQIAELQVNP